MSAIEALIKVKKQSKTDDLVRLLDEVAAYEKLSRSEAFRDLRTSKAAKKKLPLLSGAYEGDMYSLSLLTMAGHIITWLEGAVPDVLSAPMEHLAPKERKRMELMQEQIIQVDYASLVEYNHETMGEQVVAIYSEARPGRMEAILIVVREGNRYRIYQGFVRNEEKAKEIDVTEEKHKPYLLKENDIELAIETYSIQGNNAYPFGWVKTKDGLYSLMMPSYETLWLISAEDEKINMIHLSMEDRNSINMGKARVEEFAKELLAVIQKNEQEEL